MRHAQSARQKSMTIGRQMSRIDALHPKVGRAIFTEKVH